MIKVCRVCQREESKSHKLIKVSRGWMCDRCMYRQNTGCEGVKK